MITPKINGLILIDCWEFDKDLLVQASKTTKLRFQKQQIFYTNLVDNLRKFKFLGVINANTQNIETSEIVQTYLSGCTNVCKLDSQDNFTELRNSKPWKDIKHWLVVGTTWQVCVHLNDMGLCSFTTISSQYPELCFYGAPWGFLKHNLKQTSSRDFNNDLLSWTGVGKLFKLDPEVVENLDSTKQHTRTDWIRNKYINETPN